MLMTSHDTSISQDIFLPQSPSSTSPGDARSGEMPPLVLHGSIAAATVPDWKHQDALKRRFEMCNFARELLPEWSVARCHRVPQVAQVEVYHHSEYMRASFGGLQTCKSIHVCALCGTKIALRRAEEIETAVTRWADRGGALVFATFTVQHDRQDGLAALAGAMNEAYRKLHSGRPWRTFVETYQIAGAITAREYTHGVNGWHPHLHTLWFTRKLVERRKLREMEGWAQSAWKPALSRFGRTCELRYGVQLRIGNPAIAEYLTKVGRSWTIGDELANANRKRGRGKGSRPVAQLLADAGTGDELAGLRFVEYAEYTFRRNALVWTPGLRALVDLDQVEQTDEEIAAEQLAAGRLLVTLERGQWYVVLANDSRAELLLVAAEGDTDRVQAFLQLLGIELKPWQLGEPTDLPSD